MSAHQTPRPRFQMGRIIFALMLREISTTYGRSVGGYVWAVLEPVLGIALLAIVFAMTIHKPALGTNFALFYASGFLPFIMFNDMTNKTAASIRFSRPFLAYPSVTFIDTLIARILLNALTHTFVIALVIGGILAIYQLPMDFRIGPMVGALLMVMIIATGVGTLNCYLMMTFPVWERIWSILTRPLFLISGVLFTFDMVPQSAKAILWYNPLIHCVGMFRHGLYPTYLGAYLNPWYVVIIGIVLLFFGLLLLMRNHRQMLER